MKSYTFAYAIKLDDNTIENVPDPNDATERIYRGLEEDNLINRVTGKKRLIVRGLLDGEKFNTIAQKHGMSKGEVYKIKKELELDFSWLKDPVKKQEFLDNKYDLVKKLVTTQGKYATRKMTFTSFVNIYINSQNIEAQNKDWVEPDIQNHYVDIWENNAKSRVAAPREHLKTTTVCQYLIKRIYERDYPLEIIYLHLNKEIAVEKIRYIQMTIERSKVLTSQINIDQAKNWKDGQLRLLDGTTLTAGSFGSGLVGKHPHIIILDDVIDQEVIYSDGQNDKSIRKFYSDIYPMITKAGEDKKIIIIGTVQREDDLYHKLPEDFYCETLRAIVDEEKKKVLAPELFTWEELQQVKKDMSEQYGERFWLKEYMNVPFTAMGEIIKPEWIKTYTIPPDQGEVFQGWDLSVGKDIGKGDYTAGATIRVIREGELLKIYLLDMFRARVEFAERLKAITSLGTRYQPLAIGVEQNVFQYDTVNTLQKQTNLPIIGIKTIKNKIEKFRVELAPHFENGKVFIASDMREVRNELLSLPYGQYDDMADALCLAIGVSIQYGGQPILDFL